MYGPRQKALSIVIVCMNNINYLFPCLKSILKNTIKIEYKIFVVAYLFSKQNLELLRKTYPQVSIIESNEVRGYAENNNLALRQVKTEFCLVLNDDTFFEENLIVGLIDTFSLLNDEKVAIVSPVLYFPDGKVQYNGREKRTALDYVLSRLHLSFLIHRHKHSNKVGIYQSYNITGACFLIKTKLFKDVGFFDEIYFFCPEDIALSTKLNSLGFKVMVNTKLAIYHIHQASSVQLMPALLPATDLGACMYYGRNSVIIEYLLRTLVFLQASFKWFILWLIPIRDSQKKRITYKNIMLNIYTKLSPKQLFIKLNKAMQNNGK